MLKLNHSTESNGVDIFIIESNLLRVELVPEIGGRIISIIDKSTGKEFLWRNKNLKLAKSAPGSSYDSNFYGGIDELIPNDMPEIFEEINLPDHGELWTTPLSYENYGQFISLRGNLPITGLNYTKKIFVSDEKNEIEIFYRLKNVSKKTTYFMWKHHAALIIEPGDIIECGAKKAQVIDTQWSRWKETEPFDWPFINGKRADIIPPNDGSFDFLYLYEFDEGFMALKSHDRNMEFTYTFDKDFFPYGQYFASYGGLDGHYTGVLEPCNSMPWIFSEAYRLARCSVIPPGESLATSIKIYAGIIRN